MRIYIMRNLSNIIVITLLLSACGGFSNPFDDCFLDWNMNTCLGQKNRKEIESGYISYYDDNGVEKLIPYKCIQYVNNSTQFNYCLSRNNVKKVSN